MHIRSQIVVKHGSVKASVIEAAKIIESSGNRIQKAHTEFREADLILTTLDEASITQPPGLHEH